MSRDFVDREFELIQAGETGSREPLGLYDGVSAPEEGYDSGYGGVSEDDGREIVGHEPDEPLPGTGTLGDDVETNHDVAPPSNF